VVIAVAKEYLSDFFNLFYPDICLSCSQALLKNEKVICFRCESELAQTEHLNNPENKLAQRFWGRVPVVGAAALLQFQKGGHVQHLLHQMKYKGRREVGGYIGKMFATQLNEPDSVIKDVDLVIPVPLHWKKLKIRGYNQCDSFAAAIAGGLGAPWSSTAIGRVQQNVAQAKRKRYDRWDNVAGIFSIIDEQQLKDKHVLLVDDIVTTGATAEACMQCMLMADNTKVSFLAMSMALQ
jgi:ComF family protein